MKTSYLCGPKIATKWQFADTFFSRWEKSGEIQTVWHVRCFTVWTRYWSFPLTMLITADATFKSLEMLLYFTFLCGLFYTRALSQVRSTGRALMWTTWKSYNLFLRKFLRSFSLKLWGLIVLMSTTNPQSLSEKGLKNFRKNGFYDFQMVHISAL